MNWMKRIQFGHVKKSFAFVDLLRISTGKGKFNEIIEEVGELGCDVIVFITNCLPANSVIGKQNPKFLIDRQEIILDVFAARAQTKAVLQVKLARLEYFPD